MRSISSLFLLLACLLGLSRHAAAQLITDPAQLMPQGDLELETRFQRGFRSDEFKTRNEVSSSLRFGLAPALELKIDASHYVSQKTDEIPGRRSGIGDTALRIAYQLMESRGYGPAIALGYGITIPTASRSKGLGSGRVDHTVGFLASDSFHELEWEFNYFFGWVGREGESGFDDLHLLALSLQQKIIGPLGIVGEVYGAPRLNRETPGFASTDWALTYEATPRLTLEMGVDVGLTRAAPDVTYFAGIKFVFSDLFGR